MRLKHVNVRVLLSSLLAVLALSAVVASAAQASVEGPMVKVGGSRLEAGKSQELKATGRGNYTISAGTVVITCTNMSAAAGSKIIGSATGKAATTEASFTYSGCSVSGNGECKISEIKTQPLVGTMVLSENKKEIEMLLKPQTKRTFAKVYYNGKESEGCLVNEIKGDLVVALKEAAGKEQLVQVGKEPAEARTAVLKVPSQPRVVFDENTKVEVEELTAGGGPGLAMFGESTLELASGSLWGVFT